MVEMLTMWPSAERTMNCSSRRAATSSSWELRESGEPHAVKSRSNVSALLLTLILPVLPRGATAQEKAARDVHRSGVAAVAISAEGGLVASGGYDATLRIWNLAAREEPL